MSIHQLPVAQSGEQETNQGEISLRPISFINDTHSIRKLNEANVVRLMNKIQSMGLKAVYPLSVTPGGLLYAGAHRHEALKRLGIDTCWMHIHEPASLDREAIELNQASADALPMTFVDFAELVWKRLAADKTQQEVAEELGWTREAVRNYANLQNIDPVAWEVVGTTFEQAAESGDESAVPKNGTAVPKTVFTENLLRAILSLTAGQQLELVKALGCGDLTKNKFKSLAEKYRNRNHMIAWLRERLSDLDKELLAEGIKNIESGVYDNEWSSEAVKKKGKGTSDSPDEKDTPAGAKLRNLAKTLRERHEKKHSIKLIHGDFYEESAKIGAESIDAIITDPPYNISTNRIYRLANQADWNKNFGEWDNTDEAEFASNLKTWAETFFRIMKPGATGFMFVGEPYLNIAQALFDDAGFEIKSTFFWCRTNPGTSVTKADFMPAMDMAIQFVKPGARRTFNYPGDGDGEGFNWRRFSICGGNERLKDAKGQTLHPTQKPLNVLKHLMETITLPGDMVFDGFMGVGSTGKAAKAMGRKFTGIEKDTTYYESAQHNIGD